MDSILRNLSNARAKVKVKAVKRKWVFDYKINNSCTKCGFSHPAALQFHHREGINNKKREISNLMNNGVGLKYLIRETEKCDILCANCHAIVHYHPRYPSLPAGTFDFSNDSKFFI